MSDQLCYKTEFPDEQSHTLEAFDPDDPTLMDCYPTYDTNTDLGDRPPTTCSFQAKIQKKTDRALISVIAICLQYLQKVAGRITSITTEGSQMYNLNNYRR